MTSLEELLKQAEAQKQNSDNKTLSDTYREIAKIYHKNKDRAKAQEYNQKSKEAKENIPEKEKQINISFKESITRMVEMPDNLEKVEEIKKILKKHPNWVEFNGIFGDLYRNLELCEEAREQYEIFLKSYSGDDNENHANFCNNYAVLLAYHFQEHDKAKECYEKAIELNPDYADAHNNYAILLAEHFQEHEKAEQYFNKYRFLAKPEEHKRVTEITLKKYKQFQENLVIDLTYPKGHKKAGEPLEKVCFIGQSGTGKTSLLELIKSNISGDYSNTPEASFENAHLKYKFFDKIKTKTPLISFPTFSVENIKQLNSDEILEYEPTTDIEIIDFEKTDPKVHWYPIQREITKYQKQFIDIKLKLTKKLDKTSDPLKLAKEFENYKTEVEQWNKNNKNPLKELQVFLNPLLSKLFMSVNTAPSSLDDVKFIPMENITYDDDGNEERQSIPTQYLSSGTKQILSRIVPVFSLKPEFSLILIDEPENSLYPNMQKEFIDFITQESWHSIKNIKNCQFFFATHSPTIASSFDPWEIIDLRFNKSGKVVQRLFYEGERHVDNFTVHPKYLDIDSILLRVFDIDDSMLKDREEMIDLFADYNIKIRKMSQKDQQDKPEYKELVEKRNAIGRKIDWRTK